MTAGELVARLSTDPQFAIEKEAFDAKRRLEIQHTAMALDPLLKELNESGFAVASLDELRRSGIVYRAAIPILLRWLPLISDSVGKESIVRTLSVPWAKPQAAPILVAEFLKAPDRDSALKWAIGNALEVVSDESMFDQLCALARDSRHDTARQMIIRALGKFKNPQAIDLLIGLLDQDGVSGHALKALGMIRTEVARPYFERFLQDPRAWVRREAVRALAKLDRSRPSKR